MSRGTAGTGMWKVGIQNKAWEENGSDVENFDETRARVPEPPPLLPPAVWQGDAYIRISVKLDQIPHNMSKQRKMIKSWVNAPNTARPLPSVWASALHNCFCVLGCLHVRVIHWFTAHNWDVGQWGSSALYNSFNPQKDFIFAFTPFIHPQKPIF